MHFYLLKVELRVGDATNLAAANIGDNSLDAGFMLHVGMNIADKDALAASVFRALKPGAR